MIGTKAPQFTTSAVLPDGTIDEDYSFAERTRGKYALVFFYPLDFTFVCPSELIALDHRVAEFQKRNVEVLSVSVDSAYTHLAWRNTPVDKGGIGPVNFTMLADVRHEICQAYCVEAPGGVAFRGAFLIDSDGVVRTQVVHDLPLGRNIDELLRVVDALQFHEKNGQVCPAGWQKGQQGMVDSPEGVAAYLRENADSL